MEKRVGIRELKAQLSGCIRAVKEGHTFLITDRGKAVGRITPVSESLDDRVQALIRAGVISWNGQKLKSTPSAAKVKSGRKTIAEIVSENRGRDGQNGDI